MHKSGFACGPVCRKAVERKRAAETARRGLHPSTVPVYAKVQEKNHQQDMEKHKTKLLLRRYQDEALLQQDNDEKEKREALHVDLTQYWATHQRAEDSRDADLQCGLEGAFKSTIPESELGPASMQIFQGQGIGEEQRKREQMKTTARDLQVQMDDNERRHMAAKHREMLLSRELVHQDLRGVEQAALEEECRKAACLALDSYNQALQHRTEQRENLAEMWHTMTSDMMTECAEAAEREVGGGKAPQVLPDRWKGMSPEQLKTIHREREEQRLERKRQRDAEKLQEAAWGLQQLKLSREAEEEERRAAELRRQQRIQMDEYNKQLAREQQAHQEYLNRKLYTNKPTKDYFYQFNTSSR
uniref:RIB43A-like with coiled-coils protein 1 n=1 Tax=Amphiprion percula TaxID=161767 RepID=A0A3P8RT11_AMPPE